MFRSAGDQDRFRSKLRERVKELTLLHAATRLLRQQTDTERLLNELVHLLPGGWQFPEFAQARISLGDIEATTPQFRITPWVQRAQFEVRSGDRGSLEVVYLSVPPSAQVPFLPEERTLIDSLASLLASHLEATRGAEEQVKRTRAEVSRTEAETANRTRDVFLAAVAHELRRPLTAILGWTRMLRHGDSTDIDRGLQIIERSAKNQQLLIEELLDVSRIATQFGVTLSVIDVNEVLRDIADGAKPAATDRDVHIISNLVPQPTLVLGDALRLQQIVGNLVANAIKFTPIGGRVALTLEHTGLHAQIEVADNGIGIERSFLPRIFEPFVQADTYPSRSAGGLGLGLAIVRHLVELHGGTIEAQSEGPGRGTRMILRLPLAPAGAVESAIG